MAHGHQSKDKIVYVGDSRIRKYAKNNTPHDYTSYPGKSEAFIPNFLLKEWMVGCVFLVGLLVLTVSEPAPLGYPADPTNTSFIPMPDWYFLFMYQLLKLPYFGSTDYGNFVVLGTMVIPGIWFTSLVLAPFLDTGKERRFYRRPIASSLMILSLVAVSYLTVTSWHHYQEELKITGTIPEHIERQAKIDEEKKKNGGKTPVKKELAIVAADEPGAALYQKATCIQCHGENMKGKSGVPSLRGIGDKHTKDEILNIIHNGKGGMSAQYDALIASKFTDADVETLAEWLSKQKAPTE